MKPEIEGYCHECTFRRQEPVEAENPDGTTQMVIDRYCGLFDVFVPEWGFCHNFEPLH